MPERERERAHAERPGALSNFAKTALDKAQLPWPAAFGLLHVVYMAVHYLFASQAHALPCAPHVHARVPC